MGKEFLKIYLIKIRPSVPRISYVVVTKQIQRLEKYNFVIFKRVKKNNRRLKDASI